MVTVFRVLALTHNAEFVGTQRITQGQRYTGSAAVAAPSAIERNPASLSSMISQATRALRRASVTFRDGVNRAESERA